MLILASNYFDFVFVFLKVHYNDNRLREIKIMFRSGKFIKKDDHTQIFLFLIFFHKVFFFFNFYPHFRFFRISFQSR